MKRPINRISLIITTVVASLSLIAFALMPVNAGVDDAVALRVNAPAAAKAYKQINLLITGGITQTTTGAGRLVADYDYADCYHIVDVTAAQRVTTTLSTSPDGASWATLLTFDAATADTVALTRTLLYGYQMRASVALSYTNPVTVEVRCVARTAPER